MLGVGVDVGVVVVVKLIKHEPQYIKVRGTARIVPESDTTLTHPFYSAKKRMRTSTKNHSLALQIRLVSATLLEGLACAYIIKTTLLRAVQMFGSFL